MKLVVVKIRFRAWVFRDSTLKFGISTCVPTSQRTPSPEQIDEGTHPYFCGKVLGALIIGGLGVHVSGLKQKPAFRD